MALPFRLDPENRPYQVYDPVHGRMCITLWKRLSVYDGKTLVEFTPLTGRTHQLRVHCAHLGFPILGDPQYQAPGDGSCEASDNSQRASDPPGGTALCRPSTRAAVASSGQQLVARRVSLDHPLTGERLCFVSKIELRQESEIR